MTVVLGVGALLFVFFIFAVIWASRYTKVGPNQVLVVSGRKHRSWRRMARSQVAASASSRAAARSSMPVLEKVDILSLELLTIDVQTPEVYTSKGVPVKVDGVAQIKVKGDDISIAHRGGTISEQGRRTTSKTSPCRRSKVICARFSAR